MIKGKIFVFISENIGRKYYNFAFACIHFIKIWLRIKSPFGV